jgi:hypothetical protein
MRRIVKIAYIYSAASVVIGPAAVMFSSSRHPSGFDCSDPTWDGTHTSIADREAIYDHAARFMVSTAHIMLVLGASILAYLLYSSIKSNHVKEAVIPALWIFFMLFGYWLIIDVASSGWC